jgi:hypothetical protein
MIASMYFFCPSWGLQTAEQRSNILRALAGHTPDYFRGHHPEEKIEVDVSTQLSGL